jgi:hypothetical protein
MEKNKICENQKDSLETMRLHAEKEKFDLESDLVGLENELRKKCEETDYLTEQLQSGRVIHFICCLRIPIAPENDVS